MMKALLCALLVLGAGCTLPDIRDPQWWQPQDAGLNPTRYACLQASQEPYAVDYDGLFPSKAGIMTNSKLFRACMAAHGYGATW